MANRAPTPPAPPTADAAAGSYESEDHGALVAESYLPDGTFVQRFEDGTEFHYPPENPADTANYYASAYQQDPNAGMAGNNVAPVGTNPMMEFYGYGAHYQQNAAAVSTPMANANLGPAPPLGVDNAGAVDSQHSKKDRKKHRDDEAEANAAADDAAAEPGISADEDVRADELPTSGFWLVDCFSEAFFSLAFKLWACQIFFNVFMIFFFVGLDFLFATQYRLIAPPTDMQGTLFWQTMAFGCIFTVLSFFIVTLLRMLIDVMREIFQAKRTDNYLFGVQLSSSHPPYAIHVFLVVVLTVVPVMWTIILTVTKGRTFAYLIQFFLFAATILGIFTSFIIFIVMWVNSFMMKRFAYNQREEEKRVSRDYQKKYHHKKPSSSDESESESSSDDTEEGNDEDKAKRRKKRHQRRRRRRATHTTTISATGRTMAAAWYDSELTLQEFGLNNKTVRWMIPVFLFGWMPVQVVTVVFVFDSVAPSWEVSWLVVGFVIIISFIALAEGNTRFTPRVGTFVNLVVLIGFMCFGVLCTAISGNTTLVGIFIVLLLVTQGLMLRKRPYEMLPHEIEAAFGPAVDQVGANQPVDTYLCLCRNTLLEFMRCGDCCDVYGTFGKKNPKVRAVEKQYRKENLTLMTDMRLLMYYWIILWIGMAGASSFASELSPWYTGRTFAVGPGAYPSVPPTPENPLADSYGRTSKLCSLNFNAASYNATQLANLSHYNSSNPTVPFNMTAVDLALLGSVASAVGGGAITSYNIWFSISTPQLNIFNPPGGSQTDQTGRYGYQWFDVYDTMTKLRVVYVNSMPRGVGWMRTIDLYGGVLALDMAGAFAPFINVWPEDVKTDWVSGVNFLKSWYKGDVKNDFSILESHVQNQTAYGENVLLAGHGVDGAIARMVAMRNGLPSFTFNTPGTRWIRGKFDVDYASRPDMHHTIVTDCDSWQQLDRLGGDTTVYTVYSARDQHGQFDPSCSAPHSLAKTLINLCGDPLSRNILNLFN